MLQYMRRNANSTVVWLIIGAIAVVFVFFGIGGGGGGGRMITVNGEEVGYYEYSRLIDELNRNQSGDYSEETARLIRISAAQQLVSRLLTLQFGRGLGLTPSDRAVARRIAETPEFQTDGRFDNDRYLDLLEAGRLKPSFYENDTRDAMLAERSTELVWLLSRAYPPEVRDLFHFEGDQAEFDYAFFPSAVHRTGLAPSEAELADYFTATLEKWRRPATLKVEYVEIKPADFLERIEISPEELENYYQDNRQRFSHPETAEVSHILIRFPRLNPDQAEKDQTLAEAQAVYERTRTEDFAALAREMSQDPVSSTAGGSLGSINRGMTLPNFEDAAFSAPLNEVTPPVETDLGYHIIKVAERRPAGVSTLEEVRDTLTEELKKFKAREMAVAQLEDLINRAETSKLSEAAASLGLKTTVSEPFTAAEPPAFFENDAAEVSRAFSAALGRAAGAVEKEDQLTLYEPLERRESFIPALADVQAEVTEAWLGDRADQKSREAASAFLAAAAARGWNEAWGEVPAAAEAETGHSGPSGRLRMVGAAPFEQVDQLQMLAALYSVARAGEVAPTPVKGELNGRPGAFVLALTKLEKADEALLEGPAGEYQRLLVDRDKANLMYDVWQLEMFELSRSNIVVPAEYTQ